MTSERLSHHANAKLISSWLFDRRDRDTTGPTFVQQRTTVSGEARLNVPLRHRSGQSPAIALEASLVPGFSRPAVLSLLLAPSRCVVPHPRRTSAPGNALPVGAPRRRLRVARPWRCSSDPLSPSPTRLAIGQATVVCGPGSRDSAGSARVLTFPERARCHHPGRRPLRTPADR